MAKVGPKKWIPTPEILKKIEDLAERQCTWAQIAPNVGLSTSHMHAIRNEFPEISESFEKGKAKGAALLINTAYEMAMSKDKEMMKLYLKSKCDFKENDPTIQAVTPITIEVEDKIFKIGG